MSITCASTDFVLLETGLMVVRAKWNTWTEMAVWEAPNPGKDVRYGGIAHEESPIHNIDTSNTDFVHEWSPIPNKLGLTHNGALLHDEAPIRNRDFRNRGSVHDDAPQFCGIWSPVRTRPVRDLQLLDTLPSVNKLERRNDVSDAAKVRPNWLVFEAVSKNKNIGNRETLEVSERKLKEGLFEQIIFEEMMMEGKKKEVAVKDDVRFESGVVVVFKLGERGDCKEIPRMGGTVANVLAIRDENLRFGKLCDGKSLGNDSLPKKTPGRKDRPLEDRTHSRIQDDISRNVINHSFLY
jgi:hypothetical protein